MPSGALASSPYAAYNLSVKPARHHSQAAATTFCRHHARTRPVAASAAKSLLLSLVVSLAVSGCARSAQPTPQTAFRATQTPQLSDDLDLNDLIQGIEAQRSVLLRKPEKQMRFGPTTVTQGEYAKALDRLAVELRSPATTAQKLRYISEQFEFYEIYGSEDWGSILLTGYFEPVIPGSLRQTRAFSRPLYAKPIGLLTVPLAPFAARFKSEGSLKARAQGEQVVPYFSREEIDGKGALKSRGLELVWVDPIDAFFLQIQGSGTVELDHGKSLHLAYADKNGHAYVPIGKFLKERLAPKPVTMQAIVDTLRAMPPQEQDELMFKNPSYVFFRKSSQRAVTSLGVPATPGRTIAADSAFAPKGALAFIAFSNPLGTSAGSALPSGEHAGRFVLDQDSGGAITGTGRADLFVGRGADAGNVAGKLQDWARLWYLVPKN